jgi:lysophospholipase L1-like esterase
MAFGDSITAGALGTECPVGGGVNCSVTTTSRRLLLQRLFANLEVSPFAYPRVLQVSLTARYTNQNVVVANEGIPGESIAAGKDRLAGVLNQQAPQALLLQEGANDMNQARPPLDVHVEDLRSMVRSARSRGITVFVGTLLPQRPNACRGYDFCDGVNDTVLLNARIRTMAAAEGALLVDLYAAFEGRTGTLLGLDGLHPNEAGYQKMAELFFDAIKQRLEAP